MAFSSLFTLIDDIATLLDDVALMTKVAAKKTAGVLGDDLALNAEQVSGIKAERELPVVWAVAKGSFINKLILVPSALVISYFLPSIIIPLLMLGGLYLCFEGVEKIYHSLTGHHPEEISEEITDATQYEKEKIKGAIRTDLVLSAEIIVITLGTVAEASLMNKAIVVSGIAFIMTVGVYGLVAGIVKLDDGGLLLLKSKTQGWFGDFKRKFGQWLISLAPYLMKTLSFVGTIAMFLVGGGIITHGISYLSNLIHATEQTVALIPYVGHILEFATPIVLNGLIGVLSGIGALIVVTLAVKLYKKVF